MKKGLLQLNNPWELNQIKHLGLQWEQGQDSHNRKQRDSTSGHWEPSGEEDDDIYNFVYHTWIGVITCKGIAWTYAEFN